MSTTNAHIGRREGFGIGVEATPGTPVAPTTGYFRWLDQDLFPKVDFIENESAMGVVDKINDSEPVAVYSEGKFGGKVTSLNIGYLLTGFFGMPTTTGTNPYSHAFQMAQSSVPTPALTFVVVSPLQTKRYSYGVIDSLEFSAEAGGWVEVEATLRARNAVNSTDTIAIPTSELEFTSKHITVKEATAVAGLGAATAIKASKINLKLDRPSEKFDPLGTSDLPEFDRGEFEVKGEYTVRYTDTQYEEDYIAGTAKALQIAIVNGAQSLTFVAGKVKTRELTRDTSKDGVITITKGFTAELDLTTSRTIQATLVNTKTGYTS